MARPPVCGTGSHEAGLVRQYDREYTTFLYTRGHGRIPSWTLTEPPCDCTLCTLTLYSYAPSPLLPTDGRWSWADQHVHRDEPVDLGGFLFCEVFYGSDMARLAPVPGGSPATCWLAAVDAEAAQGLLTLCVILPEAEAGEGAEAALRDARTLADLAHALRSGWGEAAASELERLCMKP